MSENSTPAIRRRVPGVLPKAPGPELRPNPRDVPVNNEYGERGILQHVPMMGTQSVQNFGGEDQGYWKGRNVGARADRIAPKDGAKSPDDNSFSVPGVAVRSPK